MISASQPGESLSAERRLSRCVLMSRFIIPRFASSRQYPLHRHSFALGLLVAVWAIGFLLAIFLTYLKTSKIPDGGCFTAPEGTRLAARIACLPLLFVESARLEKVLNVLEGELPKARGEKKRSAVD